jgi:di/tricarboxylate transporter
MDKLFSRNEKVIYTATAGLSFVFLLWSYYRNETCGYDCGLFSVSTGPTVVVVLISSLFLLKYIFRRFGKKHNQALKKDADNYSAS